MNVEIDACETHTVLRPCGELDIATVAALRDAVVDTIAGGCADIVVDLTEVTFIDSSGLGVLVGATKRTLRAGGRLVVAGIDSPAVSPAFRASGLGRIIASGADAGRAIELLHT